MAGRRGGRTQPRRSEHARPRRRRFGARAVALDAVAATRDLVIIATPDAAIEEVAAALAPTVRARRARHPPVRRARPRRARRRCRPASARSTRCRRCPRPRRAASGSPARGARSPVTRRSRRWPSRSSCTRSSSMTTTGPATTPRRASPRTTSSRCSTRSTRGGTDPARGATSRWSAPSVENVAALGPAAALTGPVARGDVETVREPPRRARRRPSARRTASSPAGAHQLRSDGPIPSSTRCSGDRHRTGGDAARALRAGAARPGRPWASCRRWATSTTVTAR